MSTVTVLSGGVGAARLLRGMVRAVSPAEVTAVANVGDDTELHGLRISPDLDTITYTLAEAINTSEVLRRVAGSEPHTADVQRWWDYADRYLIDHEQGSWHHELGSTNEVQFDTWPGKPDAYHAYQAAWMQDLPTTPSYASAIKARG